MSKLVGNSDNDDGIFGTTTAANKNGIGALNTSTQDAAFPGGNALFGVTTAPGGNGVFGSNNSTRGRGVQGNGPEAGIGGFSETGVGVLAQSTNGDGLLSTTGAVGKSAIFATNNGTGDAPQGGAPTGNGVFGLTLVRGGTGVFGSNNSTQGRGVQGNGPEVGVGGFSDNGSGVLAQSKTGVAILAQGGRLAGRFEGDVEVTGDIRLVNADCAEDFDIAGLDEAKPGTVMVLDQQGTLQPSRQKYDKKVAGVISGAGDFKPGIVLDKQKSREMRSPVALLGKVYCKVDAEYSPVEVGDLLTTSDTPGYAMKATDPLPFGSVIGKALQPLSGGRDLVPIPVSLQ